MIFTLASRLALPMLSRVAEDRQRLARAFLQGPEWCAWSWLPFSWASP